MGELLKYTLHLSDNNACDILFRVFGGPAATDEYLRSMGLRDFAIEATEDDMHRNLADCYRNWTTPLEAVRLLEWLVSGKAARSIPGFHRANHDFLPDGSRPSAGTACRYEGSHRAQDRYGRP